MMKNFLKKYSVHKHLLNRDKNLAEQVRRANIKYFDAIANVYENDVTAAREFGKSSKSRIAEILKMISKKTDGVYLLDVGCGTGNVTRIGKSYFDSCIGIDLSINMLKVAKQSGCEELVQGDGTKLPFRDDSFDIVTCFSVLHHNFDISSLLEEIYRVLKRRGFLYTDWDPNAHNRKLKIWSLVAWVYSLYNHIRNKVSRRQIDFIKQNPDFKETRKLAEYYHNFAYGIDSEIVKRQLQKLGFQDIIVFFHSDAESVFKKKKLDFFTISSFIISLLCFKLEPKYKYRDVLFIAKKLQIPLCCAQSKKNTRYNLALFKTGDEQPDRKVVGRHKSTNDQVFNWGNKRIS